ncbi:methyltransferase domain-containing protein [Candidatus Woesearchaeota archaeon]|nr:methyltransferase domain-containing protein [Candidatus Woesearchaeota archaeon]
MPTCKICHSALIKILSLGLQPIANAFLKKEELSNPEYFFPLETGFCESCKMVQLIHTVPPEQMFHANYAYFSSVSRTMEEHFLEYSQELIRRFLQNNPQSALQNHRELVLEIGCNDGILLKNFDRTKFKVLGVEPSGNVAEAAQKRGLEVLNEFFNAALAERIKMEKGPAKVICAANVICHIEPIHEVAKGVSLLLDDKGVFVFEEPYVIDILEQNAYDQIYDEHVWFFCVSSLKNLFARYGLEIFDVHRQSTHGGSMRYYVCHRGAYPINEKVTAALAEEKSKGLLELRTYEQFARNVEKSKELLVKMLRELKSQGKRISGYAASSKGTVVLNYCGIGKETLDYISDNTPTKQGLFSPGKHIPIVSPEHFHQDKPDYAVLLAWNYAREISEKEKNSGTQFIVHIPYAKILGESSKSSSMSSANGLETNRLENVKLKKLTIHQDERGYLFEGLRADDAFYGGEFGYSLISVVSPGVIKGLHKHQKQTDYTLCAKGKALYVFGDGKEFRQVILDGKDPVLVAVPPGLWHGYKALDDEAVLVHIIDRVYDPNDCEAVDPYTFGDYWSVSG